MLMAASNTARQHSGRPLLSSLSSQSDSQFYNTNQPAPVDVLLSPEPRYHSDPGRLEDIFSALQQQQQPAILNHTGALHQQHAVNSRASMASNRRTFSLGDVYSLTVPLQQQLQPAIGHRKLSDVAGWELEDGSDSVPAPQRYKTELCRPFEEHGSCRYGAKCQFAHGRAELRIVSRHPKYKTEMCRTFHTTGYCPYGPRCHFIHNDEATGVEQPPTNQPQQQQLSRQSSMSSGTASRRVEHGATLQRDLERRSAQLMRLHSQQSSTRRRLTIDETANEMEPAIEWFSTSLDEAVRRPSSFATQMSAPTQSTVWSPMTPSSPSSSSSPISSAAEHLMPQYVVDPPPGLPHPSNVDALFFSRSQSQCTNGLSPTSDAVTSSSSSFNSGSLETSPTSTPVMYQRIATSKEVTSASQPAGYRSSAERQRLLSANVFPSSFYADGYIQQNQDGHSAPDMTSILANNTAMARYQVTIDNQRPAVFDKDLTQHSSAEVAQLLCGGSAERRRKSFSPASAWTSASHKHSFDEGSVSSSTESSFNDDEEEENNLQQKMASLSPNQLATLLELVKVCAPANVPRPSHDTPSAAGPTTTLSNSNRWMYGRSVSFVDPSPTNSAQWVQHQTLTASPNFSAAVVANRAAGVCG